MRESNGRRYKLQDQMKKNPYGDDLEDDEDDPLEDERWFLLSEAEQEKECQESFDELQKFIDSMTPEERFRWRRRNSLRLCWAARHKMMPLVPTVATDVLKKSQMSLWRIRNERKTGIPAGWA